jgi:murein DD-endopeptidase MepM/ murein hydrolase activator NlpD
MNARMFNPLEVMRLRNDPGLRNNVIAATFGKDVRRYADGSPKKHQGWDLYAAVGTSCFAIAEGLVLWVRNSGDYGNQLLLQFNRDGSPLNSSSAATLYAFYAHLSEVMVDEMQSIKAGQKIALTGTSGNADPKYPHLHFEIRTSSSKALSGLHGRLDPSTVLGGQLLSCRTEQIGGFDLVHMVCRMTDQPTPL